MADLTEVAEWVAGIYQLEEDDPVQGGPGGIDNLQAQQLANRTKYLKQILDGIDLGGYQPADPSLTAISMLAFSADKLIYATGADTLALTSLTSFMRTLLDDADQATARSTLGAAPLASPTFTGTPVAPTAATDTSTTQIATTAFVLGQAATAAPQALAAAAAVGASKRYAREDHAHALPALSAINPATAAATLNNGAHDLAWNWALTGAMDIGFTLGESAAATNGSGDQDLVKIRSLANSTANPLRVQTRAVDSLLISRTGNITLTALNGTAGSGTTGGVISIAGGQGAATYAGGAISIVSGAGGATSGVSGDVSIATGATTSGPTGALEIKTGQPTGGAGGSIAISAANGSGSGNRGGDIVIKAGTGTGSTTANIGGNITIEAGNSGGINFPVAGAVTIKGGAGSGGNTAPGAVSIIAGSCSDTSGADIVIQTGTGTANGKVNFVNTNVSNGSVACAFTANAGPSGAATAIQGWLAIKVNGTPRYMPYW